MLFHRFIGSTDSERLIVFVHQGLGCSAMWQEYTETICEKTGTRGLVYDRNGFGQSGETVPPRKIDFLHQEARELAELIESVVDEKQRLILYGHSEGSSIALIYASRQAERIQGIITEAAHCFVEECTVEGIAEAKKPFEEGKLDGLEKYHGSKFREVFLAWYTIWMDPEFKSWTIFDELKKIPCPALFLHGENDQYGSTKQLDELAKHYGGDCQTIRIPDCGHFPFKEKNHFVTQKTSEFIHGI